MLKKTQTLHKAKEEAVMNLYKKNWWKKYQSYLKVWKYATFHCFWNVYFDIVVVVKLTFIHYSDVKKNLTIFTIFLQHVARKSVIGLNYVVRLI